MDKIILKSKTEIRIEESSNSGSFRMRFANPAEYLDTLNKLTQENLSTYQILNSDGLVCANPMNKECLTQLVTTVRAEDGSLTGLDVVFNITDVDMMAKAMKELRIGQGVQDGAIVELAGMMGGEA